MNLFFLDFETTGLNVYHHDVIEIAIKKFNHDKYYSSLVKPKPFSTIPIKYIPPKIQNITNINDEMIIKDGILKSVAVSNMFQYIKQNSDEKNPIYIVAHNGNSFDFIIFRKLLTTYHKTVMELDQSVMSRFKYIDTVLLARSLFKYERVSQKNLCEKYNVKNDAEHRALGDVNALEKIYIHLCDALSNETDVNYIERPDIVSDMLFI